MDKNEVGVVTTPPVAKYEYTLVITGNSHEEIVKEMIFQTRGGYLIDSMYHERDEFKVVGGRKTSELKHTNPNQTAEKYDQELNDWFNGRKNAAGS